MEGYVKNASSDWAYAMKRSVRPGGKIPIDELYEQYGKKYDMKPGEEFLKWLTDVKLKNQEKWKIVYDFTESKESKKEPGAREASYSTPPVHKKLEVSDVVNLSVRKAREEVPKIMDPKLLSYALSEARQLSNKDVLCRILQKRIKDLSLSR
jgi:hypothetical protein